MKITAYYHCYYYYHYYFYCYLVVDDNDQEGNQADNELRELKNFADPIYSESKALPAIDWVPKMQV
jgi:hypothetical protein